MATDNASDATLEVSKTFTKIMDHLNTSLQTERNGYIFDVKRRCVQLGDPFHIDNLAMTWASRIAFGDTESGKHEQLHHRQLIQSFFDIFVRDRSGCQSAMNYVLEGTGESLIVTASRERQQRWLVNQRSATWLIKALNTKCNMENVPALIAWGLRMEATSQGSLKKNCRDFNLLVQMRSIIAAIYLNQRWDLILR